MDKQQAPSGQDKKAIYKSCIVAFSLTFFIYLLCFTPARNWLNPDYMENLKNQVDAWYIIAPSLFLVVGALSIGFGIPRWVVSIFAGAIFGFWAGLALIELTCIVGAIVTFIYARWARQIFLVGRWKRQLPIIDQYMQEHAFLTTLLLRLVPLPGVVVNILTGLSCVKVKPFLIASTIGFLPQNIVFTLYGCGWRQQSLTYALGASSAFVGLAIMFYFMYQRIAIFRDLFQRLQNTKKEAQQ